MASAALYPRARRRYKRSVDFRILGPLQVLDGEAEVQLGPPKERALLGVLLLGRGAVVSRNRLIDELWGASPPATAAKALNVHVSQLRKALGRGGVDPITTRSPGYALTIDPESLDVERFDRLVAEARRDATSGETQSASELFRSALALWRGSALEGVTLESTGRNEAARLDELRLAAQMDAVDCDLALGRHAQAIGELEALVAAHPLHERLRGQYMLALYRAGRQADALAAYQDARATLVDQLGLEPSAPLQRLERGILNHDPALELPAGITRSTPAADRREHRRRVRLLAVPLAVVLVAALAVFIAARSGGATSVPPNSVAVIDPTTDAVVSTVGVGIDPGAVTVGTGAVWVANETDRTLSRIDPHTRAVTRNLNLGGTPTGVATSHDAVWVAYGRLGSVARIDPEFESVAAALRVAGRGYGHATTSGSVATGPDGVWVAFGDSTVAKVSRDGSRVLRSGYAGAQPSAIALGEGAVWVSNAGDNTVSELSPETAKQLAVTNVAMTPSGVVVGGRSVWVSALDADSVSRIEAGSSRTIPAGDGPLGIAFGDGSVWVANSRNGTVSRIDPQRGTVVATIHVGHHPHGIAVGDGAVWVTVDAA
jgi:YVTN family beta-propeller protein